MNNPDDFTCWASLLIEEVADQKDPGPIIFCTLSDEEMKEVFDSGYGGTQGKPFTAWTENRVYFPVMYDGSEWVGSAPRNPCEERTHHQGG